LRHKRVRFQNIFAFLVLLSYLSNADGAHRLHISERTAVVQVFFHAFLLPPDDF
jgi:hypothetical protein